MFKIDAVSIEQVKNSIATHMTITLVDENERLTEIANELLAEEIAQSSEYGFDSLSSHFYEVASSMHNGHEDFPLFWTELGKVYADLFSDEVSEDITANWEGVFLR